MTEKMLKYEDVEAHFTANTIHDRYRYLYDKQKEYIDTRKWDQDLFISEDLLHRMVMDYFTDVYRLKRIHKIDRINKDKIVAYTVFWLMRRKPIQFRPRDPSKSSPDDQKLAFANEGFCTTLIADELLLPDGTVPLSDDKEEKFFAFIDNIYFTLKYRNIDRQALETIIYAFKTGWACAKQE